MNGLCDLPDAIQRYNATVGTILLHCHLHLDNNKLDDSINSFEKFDVTGAPKNQLINAAAIFSITDRHLQIRTLSESPNVVGFGQFLFRNSGRIRTPLKLCLI